MKPVCKVYAHLKVGLLSLSVVCGQDLITRAARRAFLRGESGKGFPWIWLGARPLEDLSALAGLILSRSEETLVLNR